MKCKYCHEYFDIKGFNCWAWQGECDCPRCQGMCNCGDLNGRQTVETERKMVGEIKYDEAKAYTDGILVSLMEKYLDPKTLENYHRARQAMEAKRKMVGEMADREDRTGSEEKSDQR